MHSKKLSVKLGLIIITLVGAILRLTYLGRIPMGYTWDEMGIAYDGWSIATQGTDHLGHVYPLTFESFGDYKAPLLPYILSGIYLIFPFNEIWIRVVSALFGIGLIPLTYGLGVNFFPKKQSLRILASFLVAISPVLVHWSRVGFEANLAIFFFSLGVYFFSRPKLNIKVMTLGTLGFMMAMLTYQSPKMVVPLWLIGYYFIYLRKLGVTNRLRGYYWFLTAELALLLIFMINASGGIRATQTLLFWSDGGTTPIDWLIKLGNNLRDFLTWDFWLWGKQETLRNMVSGFGPVYILELPFLIFGIIWIIWRGDYQKKLLVWWVITGLLPSMLSKTSPHMLRMSLIFPAIQLLTAYGMGQMIAQVRRRHQLAAGVMKYGLIIGLIGCVMIYLGRYYYQYAIEAAPAFSYGYKEVLEITRDQRKMVDKTIITAKYGQPYIYVLVYGRIKPKEFLAGALTNFEFRMITPQDTEGNTLLIASPEEISPIDPRIVQKLTYPGTDEVVFVIARNQ